MLVNNAVNSAQTDLELLLDDFFDYANEREYIEFIEDVYRALINIKPSKKTDNIGVSNMV